MEKPIGPAPDLTKVAAGGDVNLGSGGDFTKNADGTFTPIAKPATPVLDKGSNPLIPATSNSSGVTTAPPTATATPTSAPANNPPAVIPGAPAGSLPTPPDLVGKYNDLRNSTTLPDLQNQLLAIQAEKATINADVSSFKQNEPVGESEGFGTSRISEGERNANARLDHLAIQETLLTGKITNANTYINEVMNLTGQDFSNATQFYQSTLDNAIKVQQAYQTQADKEQTASAGYLNAVKTMMTTSGKTWNDISPQMKATINLQETKAGWIPGTLEMFARSKPAANLLSSVQGVDPNSGMKTITFIYANPDGTPGMVRTISTGQPGYGSGAGSGGAIGTTGASAIDPTLPGYTSTPVAGGRTQAAIDAAALQYAMGEGMPSMGQGSSGQAAAVRSAIQNRAAEMDPGGNMVAHKAEVKAQSAALSTQVDYINTTQRALRSADDGMKQLTTAFKGKVNDQTIPVANILANIAKYNLNPGEVSAYKAALAEVGNEYSQVFSRGGQNTVESHYQAKDIIDGNISVSDLAKVGAELQAQGQIVIGSANQQIRDIQNKITSIVGGGGSGSYAPGTVIKNAKGQMGVVQSDGSVQLMQ